MRLGLDFDNTLVCYDGLFRELGRERGLPPDVPADKTAVRDWFRAAGRESEWTAMQGEAYGRRIGEAALFPGALDFVRSALGSSCQVYVVSHKTLQPFAGPACNLHEAARGFLRASGLVGAGLLTEQAIFFEETKEAKAARITALGCDIFVDDLPEFLSAPFFPSGVRRILFDPSGALSAGPWESAGSWGQVAEKVLHSPGGTVERTLTPSVGS